jgi:hypothetical protein
MQPRCIISSSRPAGILNAAGIITLTLTLLLLGTHVQAFSLLGPYADWMQPTNGFRLPGDIGGPVNLGEEYRWNVPALTYAFEGGFSDESFLDYFGSNGVWAVEQAISILNNLPPASQINLADYPETVVRMNYAAQSEYLLDLKSQTLTLLLEQLGLGSPTRNIACLRSYSIVVGTVVGQVINRDFDPASLLVSSNVNGTLYGYELAVTATAQGPGADAFEYPVDPMAPALTAVADGSPSPGTYYTGLSRDDVGGLRYLYRSNNFNFEPLLPNVHGCGANASSFVTTAIRAGVEKITFSRPAYYQGFSQPSQFFTPFTNQFTDTCLSNGTLVTQQLERVETQPDIIFASAPLDDGSPVRVQRTSTTNWLASDPLSSGPGIIRPQIRIVFNRSGGPLLQTKDTWSEGTASVSDYLWGSFDGSTNAPVIYPVGIPVNNTNKTVVQLWLHSTNTDLLQPFTWGVPVPIGGSVTPQTSTNLIDWVTLPTMVNHGVTITWYHWVSSPARFFRIRP